MVDSVHIRTGIEEPYSRCDAYVIRVVAGSRVAALPLAACAPAPLLAAWQCRQWGARLPRASTAPAQRRAPRHSVCGRPAAGPLEMWIDHWARLTSGWGMGGSTRVSHVARDQV